MKTSICLKFRPAKDPSRLGALYFQISHARISRQVATGQHISASEWDEAERRVTTAHCPAARRDSLAHIRATVQGQTARLRSIVHNLQALGDPFTSDDIVRAFLRQDPTATSVFSYMERRISLLTNRQRFGTAKTCRSTLFSLRRFRAGVDLPFSELDANTVEAYEAWLKEQGRARNTISFYMRTLRTVCRRAHADGLALAAGNPFARVFTGMDITPKRAIPMGYISRLKAIDLTATPAQEFARNIFMLSFYLRGMSFVDMAYLKKGNLHGDELTYSRRKTGQQLRIHWESQMQRVLDALPPSAGDYLLPIITREDGTERRQYQNKLTCINRALKRIARRLGASTSWTSYGSRHSWASVAQECNVPLQVISSGMGHTSLSTTQIYLDSITTEKVDEANRHIISEV